MKIKGTIILLLLLLFSNVVLLSYVSYLILRGNADCTASPLMYAMNEYSYDAPSEEMDQKAVCSCIITRGNKMNIMTATEDGIVQSDGLTLNLN